MVAGGGRTVGAQLNSEVEGLTSRLGDAEQGIIDLTKSIQQNLGVIGLETFRKLNEALSRTIRLAGSAKSATQGGGYGAGATSAARLSAAHAHLTGMGRAGGYAPRAGGRDIGDRAMAFAGGALSPLSTIPKVIVGLGQAGGKAIGKIPFIGPMLQPLLAGGGVLGGAAASMGLGFATNFIRGSMTARPEFEEATRFLSPGMTGLGSTAGGLLHGYGATETVRHREAVMRAIGGGGTFNRERISGKPPLGMENVIQGLSNRFRQPVGTMVNSFGAFRSGGMSMGETNSILQKINKSVLSQVTDRESPEYVHRMQEQIRGLQTFVTNQVSLTGRISATQVAGASNMMTQLSTRFAPSQAGYLTNLMTQGALRPSGGEAGQAFMMRALGFANPLMGQYQTTAAGLGFDNNLMRRRNLFEYKRAMEDPTTRVQAMITGLKTEFGGRTDVQGWMLNTLIPSLGFSQAEGIMQAMAGGGGLSKDTLDFLINQNTLSLKDMAGKDTTDMTGTGMPYIKRIKDYHNYLIKVGGSPQLEALHEFMRVLQMTAGQMTTAGIKSAGGEEAIKALTAEVKAMGKDPAKLKDLVEKWLKDMTETLPGATDNAIDKMVTALTNFIGTLFPR